MTMVRTPLEAWVKTRIGLPDTQELTLSALADYQLERLRATLEYVDYASPFYRRYLSGCSPAALESLQDFSQWPLTTSNDLRKDPMAFLCVSQSRVERVVTLPTRSASEAPKRLFFSEDDLELAVDFFHQGFSTGLALEQRMLVLMPCQKPNSVGDLLSRGLARLPVDPIRHGPMQSPQAVVETVLRYNIDCMVGIPSEMAMLARYPGTADIPKGQIRSIWLGTQNTQRSLVEEIERFWGSPVYQHYGAAEMCPGGGVQCAARDGFHLREADLYIEIVDPRTARPVADGEFGEVVVTTLTREAMPLIRYRTGHGAAIMTAPCPCGSKLRRMSTLRSRVA
jgi:phenylacetate-CoA ligase